MEHGIEQATVEIAVSTTSDPIQSDFTKIHPRATGFYARRDKSPHTYLITNWHVVTGKNPQSEEFIAENCLPPRALLVKEWPTDQIQLVPLYDEQDRPRWIEIDDLVPFEIGTSKIDVVAIPIRTQIYPILIDGMLNSLYARPEPTDEVAVLGYPYSRLKCIWKTCHVAENIMEHRTYFLVNGRTKEGMSGSGVFTSLNREQHGNVLLGVYSGRIDDRDVNRTLNDLDIGVVWKLHALNRLLPFPEH